MTLPRQLSLTIVAAIIALALTSLLVGAGLALAYLSSPSEYFPPEKLAWWGSLVAFLLGLTPCLLLGVPGYVYLLRTGLARWWSVMLLGALAGLSMILFEEGLIYLACGAGALCAGLTHFLYCWKTRSCRRRKVYPLNPFRAP